MCVMILNYLDKKSMYIRLQKTPNKALSCLVLSFGLIHNNFRSVTKWNLKWHFILVFFKAPCFFFPIARNVLNVKAQVSVFVTTLLVDWPHHQYYITDIKSDPRGSYSNWWVSEKRNTVPLGRVGYIDDELIVYNSMTVSQKSSQPGVSEQNFGATGHALMFGGKLAD